MDYALHRFDAPQDLLIAGLLLMLRLSSAFVTMPVFSSSGIPMRVKAMLTFVTTLVLAPAAAYVPKARLSVDAASLVGEIMVGLSFGLTLSLLLEATHFAASLMSGAFSFSLANLIDPNSMVETEVLGILMNWFSLLVLLGAGLHRTMLSALIRTFVTIPLGTAFVHPQLGTTLSTLISGVFLAGIQLAAPVVAAALLAEVAVGLLSRMAPALPAQIASVPVKTLLSYVTMLGSLAIWPSWIEHRFVLLLESAAKELNG